MGLPLFAAFDVLKFEWNIILVPARFLGPLEHRLNRA